MDYHRRAGITLPSAPLSAKRGKLGEATSGEIPHRFTRRSGVDLERALQSAKGRGASATFRRAIAAEWRRFLLESFESRVPCSAPVISLLPPC